jgi:Tol biopolymer transport system component
MATLLLVLAAGPASGGATSPGITQRVSVSGGGAQANGGSNWPSLSADGRFAAFSSTASNLVAGDTNGQSDVFVRDRQTGATERVSVASDGSQANLESYSSAISADGRFVAFQSFATNLVVGDTNGTPDVFVHDRTTGTTERVDLTGAGAQTSGIAGSGDAFAISGDGRFVAFSTAASDVVAGDTNAVRDIFVRDRQLATTERVSVGAGAAQANGASSWPAISRDGRFVAFQSDAQNLVPGLNGVTQTFMRDRQSATTELVSAGAGGVPGNGASAFWPALSADGRFVAFVSSASNLVAGDTNGVVDAFVLDRTDDSMERASVDDGGTEGNNLSDEVGISGDGRFVAFTSFASNLVPADGNATRDAFLRDRQQATTERISVDSSGGESNDASFEVSVSDDGNVVAFLSRASNLVPGDTNGVDDIFTRTRGSGRPGNDDFESPQPLEGRYDFTYGDNTGATKQAGEPAHAGNAGGASIWYVWTAPSSGRVTFSTCDSDFDTLLAVYTGATLGALAEVASNDDACGTRSKVTFVAAAGTSYRVAVDGSGGVTGTVALDWRLAPPNDPFAAAELVSGDTGYVEGDNIGATIEPGEPAHAGTGGSSTWYRWTAPSSGPATFDTCDSDFDTVLAVYTGTTVAGLAPVVSDDDGCAGYESRVSFIAAAGTEYRIAVDGYLGEQGFVALSWDRTPVAPRILSSPAISGTLRDGETLQATTGQWAGTVPLSFSYVWARCDLTGNSCFEIPGAQAATYRLTAADVGRKLRVFVRATNLAGTAEANSAATAVVQALAPSNTEAPAVVGTARVGETLTAETGIWNGSQPIGYAYQWQTCNASGSDCHDIANEVSETLLLRGSHVGSTIRMVITATNVGGSAIAASVVTAPVRAASPPKQCVVPGVKGMTLARARAVIARAACKVGRVSKAYSRRVARGRVISQTPRPKLVRPAGTRVNLVISRGAKPKTR